MTLYIQKALNQMFRSSTTASQPPESDRMRKASPFCDRPTPETHCAHSWESSAVAVVDDHNASRLLFPDSVLVTYSLLLLTVTLYGFPSGVSCAWQAVNAQRSRPARHATSRRGRERRIALSSVRGRTKNHSREGAGSDYG